MYSFICQGTSTKRQQRDLFGFRVKLPPYAIKNTLLCYGWTVLAIRWENISNG